MSSAASARSRRGSRARLTSQRSPTASPAITSPQNTSIRSIIMRPQTLHLAPGEVLELLRVNQQLVPGRVAEPAREPVLVVPGAHVGEVGAGRVAGTADRVAAETAVVDEELLAVGEQQLPFLRAGRRDGQQKTQSDSGDTEVHARSFPIAIRPALDPGRRSAPAAGHHAALRRRYQGRSGAAARATP